MTLTHAGFSHPRTKSHVPFPLHRLCESFVTQQLLLWNLLATRPTPNLEDHTSSTVRYCLFNVFAAILHIGGRSSSATRGHAMPWWQGPNYHGKFNCILEINILALPLYILRRLLILQRPASLQQFFTISYNLILQRLLLTCGIPQSEYTCIAFYRTLKYCIDCPMMVVNERSM